MAKQRVRVDCYAGYRGEETPRRFELGEKKLEVVKVISRWVEPDRRCFRVRADDGKVYVLRHEMSSGEWELAELEG